MPSFRYMCRHTLQRSRQRRNITDPFIFIFIYFHFWAAATHLKTIPGWDAATAARVLPPKTLAIQ